MKKAFTLIELLVVVAIIALLISILLPSLNNARKQARETVCMSNMRQLAIAWVTYSNDWNGHLPGSGRDHSLLSTELGWVEYQRRTWCWLGTRTDRSGPGDLDQIRGKPPNPSVGVVPRQGTIYKYAGENAAVYKCPEDMVTAQYVDAEVSPGTFQGREKPPYSYTAPIILTGAPSSLLVRTRWPETFDSTWNDAADWNKATNHSVPWMITEEDDSHALAVIYDSSWCNNDQITDRHRGKGAVNHTDGSATMRKYQKRPVALNAWKVYYELADGRVVTAGTYQLPAGSPTQWPRLGFLRTKYAVALNQ